MIRDRGVGEYYLGLVYFGGILFGCWDGGSWEFGVLNSRFSNVFVGIDLVVFDRCVCL